jgi:excisionase family DNA binding protein
MTDESLSYSDLDPREIDLDDAPLPESVRAMKCQLLRGIRNIIREEQERLLGQERPVKPLLSLDDLANTLGVSKRTAQRIVDDGEIDPIWIRSQKRFRPEAVRSYLRRKSGKG